MHKQETDDHTEPVGCQETCWRHNRNSQKLVSIQKRTLSTPSRELGPLHQSWSHRKMELHGRTSTPSHLCQSPYQKGKHFPSFIGTTTNKQSLCSFFLTLSSVHHFLSIGGGKGTFFETCVHRVHDRTRRL